MCFGNTSFIWKVFCRNIVFSQFHLVSKAFKQEFACSPSLEEVDIVELVEFDGELEGGLQVAHGA